MEEKGRTGFDFFEVEFGNKPSVAQALGRLGADIVQRGE